MSYHPSPPQPHFRNRARARSSDSDDSTPSSGPVTPTGAGQSTSSSGFLTSSVSSLWGGLVRRFSSEPGQPTSPTPGSSFYHAQTFPDGLDGSGSHNGIDGVYNPPKLYEHRTTSPMRPPPLEPLQLNGFAPDTSQDARLLTAAVAEEIRIMIPARLSIVDEWNLVYSLEQDGASLQTLYEKCARYSGTRVGWVLVVRDREGGIFGAYLSDPPAPHPQYFGNGECFLWRASVMAPLPPPPSTDTTRLTGRSTTIPSLIPPPANIRDDDGFGGGGGSGSNLPHPPASPSIRFKAFPYSGVNEYYMLCEQHFLSVGAGGGKYGLWLDDGLERGISSTCQTFGNERLSDEGEKFGILGVEMWVIGAAGL